MQIFQASAEQCSPGLAIPNSEKVLFQEKTIQQNIKCHFVFIKVTIHNENSHKFLCQIIWHQTIKRKNYWKHRKIDKYISVEHLNNSLID